VTARGNAAVSDNFLKTFEHDGVSIADVEKSDSSGATV